jgi:uncharacterized protein (DUF58 family)
MYASLRNQELIDWAELSSLRLRARAIADGLYAGTHRSIRKGSGVEFGGHRPYVPGDDLRFLDRRAMLRHGKPFIRELQTDTDRCLRLLVDASASMGYKGKQSKLTKLEYAGLLAAALARVAQRTGDPISLDLLGGKPTRSLPPSSGRDAFERVVGVLEAVKPFGNLLENVEGLDLAMANLSRTVRKGTVMVAFSDLLDTHPESLRRMLALGTGGRILHVVQILDRDEAELPFDGPVRLRAMEGTFEVETDAAQARSYYLEKIEEIRETWRSKLQGRGGRLITAQTHQHPITVVREILVAVAGGGR